LINNAVKALVVVGFSIEFCIKKTVVFSNYHAFKSHIPLRREIYVFFVWKKSSDDAKIIILNYLL